MVLVCLLSGMLSNAYLATLLTCPTSACFIWAVKAVAIVIVCTERIYATVQLQWTASDDQASTVVQARGDSISALFTTEGDLQPMRVTPLQMHWHAPSEHAVNGLFVRSPSARVNFTHVPCWPDRSQLGSPSEHAVHCLYAPFCQYELHTCSARCSQHGLSVRISGRWIHSCSVTVVHGHQRRRACLPMLTPDAWCSMRLKDTL